MKAKIISRTRLSEIINKIVIEFKPFFGKAYIETLYEHKDSIDYFDREGDIKYAWLCDNMWSTITSAIVDYNNIKRQERIKQEVLKEGLWQ